MYMQTSSDTSQPWLQNTEWNLIPKDTHKLDFSAIVCMPDKLHSEGTWMLSASTSEQKNWREQVVITRFEF